MAKTHYLVLTGFLVILTLSNACLATKPPANSLPPAAALPKPDNRQPVIQEMTAEKSVTVSSNSMVSCTAIDPDRDILYYSWSSNYGSFSGEGAAISWTAPNVAGEYLISVTVTDGKGGKATSSIPITVALVSQTNKPPRVSLVITPKGDPPINFSSPDKPIRIRQWDIIDIECIAEDPEGDEMSFTWSSTGGRLKGDGNKVIYLPTENGDQTVKATVSDKSGKQTLSIAYFHVQCCGKS
jgi:hypothetical protein